MVTRFNADEVFEVAIRTEQNGAAFYRKAAELFAGKLDTVSLKNLAAMEDRHEQTFVRMRKQLAESEKKPTVFDPNDELSLYLGAMADTHGGEGSPKAAEKLTGNESMEDILQIALDLEQKSILFYVGLRDLVPENLGREQIDEIIAEEKSHVSTIGRMLENVRQKG